MTHKKYLSSAVYMDQLEQQGIAWERINYPREVLFNVSSNTAHAIVKNRETREDIGIVLYKERNGLPYSEFDQQVQYMFLKMGTVLCCSRPKPIN